MVQQKIRCHKAMGRFKLSDKELEFLTKSRKEMRVCCVMMQRNEANALEPWLRYHGYLFGFENLVVIDHGSEHPAVIATLTAYQAKGVQVVRLPATADYRRKGEFVSQTMRFLDALGHYDILLPLDCDEFLVLRGESRQYLCAQDAVLDYLATLRGRETILEIKENLINVLAAPGKFWPFPYQKVFFAGGQCGVVDHGSHQDVSGRGRAAEETRLAYLHFHHRPYAQQVKASLEKLRPFVDVEDQAALEAFRGPGWHLVPHILRGEAPYAGMMKPGPGAVEVTGLLALFRELGIDPLFTER
jgi:hypothetical protein